MSVISIRWLMLCAWTLTSIANAVINNLKRRSQHLGFMFSAGRTPFQSFNPQGGGNGNRRPNCKGRRKNRPECQSTSWKLRIPTPVQGGGAVSEAFNQVQWFNQLASPNKSALQIPNLPGTPNKGTESRFFALGSGPDRPFQQCVTPRFESGHCRYLQHCILPEFANNFFTFLNYVCFINGVYIGACCPDSRYPDTAVTTSTTTSTTTTPRPTTAPSQRGCGLNAKDGKRIVGGQKADPQEWPWMAALLRNGQDQYCGGVLITNAHVLTAAHCTKPFSPSSITVRLGEYTFDQTQDSSHRDFQVKSIQQHLQYNTETYENDIAIISLQGSVENFNDFIWPICLPPADNNKYVAEKATVTGWGTIYYGGPISSTLQEVTLPVWTNDECDAAYDEANIVDNFLCAGIKETGGKDSCQGDSGGPLQWQGSNGRWAAIGVVSWGIKCAEPGNPGVYTRVNNYIDWIKDNSI
ncbi:unnamed protein product, partial [Meganyctiphanes norvegica]